MVFVNPMVDIAFISVGVAILSQAIQRLLGSKEAMKKHQDNMKSKQEKMKELMKKTDKQSQQELEKHQAEMLESMNAMMKGSMKMMVVSMIVFIPILYLLRISYEGTIMVPHPYNIDIPFFGATAGWLEIYIVFSLVASLVLNSLLGIYDKMKKKEVSLSAKSA